LCPGPTETNFENRASNGTGIRLFRKSKLPSAVQVAEYGWKSMMKGKTVAVHGWNNRWLLFLIRFLPRKIVTHITGEIYKNE
jgi:short-subunit dehydrogenase